MLLKNYFFFHISAEFILYYLWEMYSIEFFVLTLLQKMFCYKIYWFLECKAFCSTLSKPFLLKIQKIEFQ